MCVHLVSARGDHQRTRELTHSTLFETAVRPSFRKNPFLDFIVHLILSHIAKTPEQKPSFLPCYTRTETVTSLRGPVTILGA